jgi:hypothetical protein
MSMVAHLSRWLNRDGFGVELASAVPERCGAAWAAAPPELMAAAHRLESVPGRLS